MQIDAFDAKEFVLSILAGQGKILRNSEYWMYSEDVTQCSEKAKLNSQLCVFQYVGQYLPSLIGSMAMLLLACDRCHS